MSFFEMLGGEPPTPEQMAEREKRRLVNLANVERMLTQAQPHIQAARDALRELNRMGFTHGKLESVRHKLAIMADDVQNYLERPPPDGN